MVPAIQIGPMFFMSSLLVDVLYCSIPKGMPAFTLERRANGVSNREGRGRHRYRWSRKRVPRRVAEFLERRGPIGIKLGQFLSLRPDLLPQEYCDEPMRLLDQVPYFSWDEAREILRGGSRGEPEEVFAWFDKRPLAAGSLAQVHLARTHEGDEVAVKIQRPGIREKVRVGSATSAMGSLAPKDNGRRSHYLPLRASPRVLRVVGKGTELRE